MARISCSDKHETVEYGSDRGNLTGPACPVCDAIAELTNAEETIKDLEDEIMELQEELANYV